MIFKKENEKNEIVDDHKHLSKNSSWKSLQDLKKLTRSLKKSSSQVINPIKPNDKKTTLYNNPISSEVLKQQFAVSSFNENFNEKLSKINVCNTYIQTEKTEFVPQKKNFQVKFENLLKLYEKKCLENDKLIEEVDKLESQILNLNIALKRTNDEIHKLNNNKLLSINNSQTLIPNKYSFQPYYKVESEIDLKNRIIDDLKSEIVNLNKKNFNLEMKLEKSFMLKIEEEMKKYKEETDLKIKETILKKEMDIKEVKIENNMLKEKINEFQISFISIQEHENLLNKLKYEIKLQYEGMIDIITKDFTKKLSEHVINIDKPSVIESNTNKLTSKGRIDVDFDTFSIKQEAVINCDSYLINNKNEVEEIEPKISEETKINNFSKINVNLNTRKYLKFENKFIKEQ